MKAEESPKKSDKNTKPGGSGFLAFAIIIFSALAIGLAVILIRSKA